MKKLLPVLLLVSLVGCSASMVNTRGKSTSEFAPVNEKDRTGGTIKYLSQGAKFILKQRREDAYKKMYASCAGPYRITTEGPVQEGGITTAVPGPMAMATYDPEQYWYINFDCEK